MEGKKKECSISFPWEIDSLWEANYNPWDRDILPSLGRQLWPFEWETRYAHKHTYTYIYIYMHVYMCLCMCICIYVCVYIYMYIYNLTWWVNMTLEWRPSSFEVEYDPWRGNFELLSVDIWLRSLREIKIKERMKERKEGKGKRKRKMCGALDR